MRTPRPWQLPTQPVSRAILALGGVSEEMIATQLRSGRLVRVRRGVFVAASAWPDDAAGRHVVLARAESVACPGAVICRQSAAVVWGLPSPGLTPWYDQPVSVAEPRDGGHRTRTGVAEHHIEDLPADHLDRDPDGYPVTSLVRTAVDLAAGLALPEALAILDAAARQLCERFVAVPKRSDYANPRLADAARELLADMASVRRRGGLLAAIALADPRRESPAESLSAGHFHLAGLPAPVCQFPVRSPMGMLYPDFYWAQENLVGECDGAVKYADGSAAAVAERMREQQLRDLGYRMVRWLAIEIMTRPDVVVERVARSLGL